MLSSQNDKKIILAANLQGYFFNDLVELNKRTICPVPESVIYYSSQVLGKFALSQDFFDVSEGKVREKVLGLKLLEAAQLGREEQKRVYKDVADMSLVVCGYFAESVNKKIVDVQYYSQLGKMAYAHLNNVSPAFLDIPSFYRMVATCFTSMTTLMAMLAIKNRTGEEAHLLFSRLLREEDLSQSDETLGGRILPFQSKTRS